MPSGPVLCGLGAGGGDDFGVAHKVLAANVVDGDLVVGVGVSLEHMRSAAVDVALAVGVDSVADGAEPVFGCTRHAGEVSGLVDADLHDGFIGGDA